jgi:hypothetical protein
MNGRAILLLCAVAACIIFVTVPFACAATGAITPTDKSGPLARDNPELISAEKTHVAYLGEVQQARMDGVIQYIDSISGGRGSYNLRMMQEDYMVTASSIPFMHTSDEIDAAREDMRVSTQQFAEETKAQMGIFNGSTDMMREYTNASMDLVEGSFSNLSDSLWLARDTARLTVFNTYSEKRKELLSTLKAKGVDTSLAEKITTQINAQRSELQAALSKKQVGTIQNVNSGLKTLNFQFRDIVQGYRTDLKIQLDKAAILAMPD